MGYFTSTYFADVNGGYDGATVSGSSSFTTAVNITPDDAGKYIRIAGAGPATRNGFALKSGHYYAFTAQILAVSRVSGVSHVTLGLGGSPVTAPTTGTGLSFVYGSDNGPILTAALAAGKVPVAELPPGTLGIFTPVILPSGAQIYGKGGTTTKLVGLNDQAWVLDYCTAALLPGGTGFQNDSIGPQLHGFWLQAQMGARLGWLSSDTVIDPLHPSSPAVSITTLNQTYLVRVLVDDVRFTGNYDPNADPNAFVYSALPSDAELQTLGGTGLQLGCRCVNAAVRSSWFEAQGTGLRASGTSHLNVCDSTRFHANARHVAFDFVPSFNGYPEGDTNAINGCKFTIHYRTAAIYAWQPYGLTITKNNFECAITLPGGLTAPSPCNQYLRTAGGGGALRIRDNVFSNVVDYNGPCPIFSIDSGDAVNFRNWITDNFFGGGQSSPNPAFEFLHNYTYGTSIHHIFTGNAGNFVAPSDPTVQVTFDLNGGALASGNVPSFNGPFNTRAFRTPTAYASGHAYAANDLAIDSNGNYELCTVAGTSAGATMATGFGATTSDGSTLKWLNLGPAPTFNPSNVWPWAFDSTYGVWTVTSQGTDGIISAKLLVADPGCRSFTLRVSGISRGTIGSGGNGYLFAQFFDSTGSPTTVVSQQLAFGKAAGAGILETFDIPFTIPAGSANANSYVQFALENRQIVGQGVDVVEVRLINDAIAVATSSTNAVPQTPGATQIATDAAGQAVIDMSAGTEFYIAVGSGTTIFPAPRNGMFGQDFTLILVKGSGSPTVQFLDFSTNPPAWNSGIGYQPGDEARDGGVNYVSRTANTNSQPGTHPADWSTAVSFIIGPSSAALTAFAASSSGTRLALNYRLTPISPGIYQAEIVSSNPPDVAGVIGGTALLAGNNLSDLASAATARTNLGVDAAIGANWAERIPYVTSNIGPCPSFTLSGSYSSDYGSLQALVNWLAHFGAPPTFTVVDGRITSIV